MDIPRFIIRLHAGLTGLYPRGFRVEFGGEVEAVFAEALAEAMDRGWRAVVRVCLRESVDLPRALLTQHWLYAGSRAREAAMSGVGYPGEKPGLVPLPGGALFAPVLSALQQYPTIRRLIDIVFSVLLLVLAAPLLLIVAVLVKLDSAGPVLFRQERVGRDGDQYTMYKIRSMVSGAGGMPRPSGGPDPRITRVGRVIRKLRLDELPQLYNVLRGEMSILGPRPGLPRS